MEENNKTKAPQLREPPSSERENNNNSSPHDGENAKKAHADKNARTGQRE